MRVPLINKITKKYNYHKFKLYSYNLTMLHTYIYVICVMYVKEGLKWERLAEGGLRAEML